jgi:hypothetical protein
MIELTQEEVDDLEEDEKVTVRWPDRSIPQKVYKVVLGPDGPSVREFKKTGFAVIIPLFPVADENNRKRIRVFKEEEHRPYDPYGAYDY